MISIYFEIIINIFINRDGKNMFFFKIAYFGQNMLFYIGICYLFIKISFYFWKNTKLCTYMPKISKKEHLYLISVY